MEPIILGIIQGITEWLPISSSGNLILVMVGILKKAPALALRYSIFLHLGTLLAAVIYFRKDLWDILKNLKKYKPNFKTKENSLISLLIITTFITSIIGYPLYKTILSFRGELILAIVGFALIFIGLFQKIAHKKKITEEKQLTLKDSILLGIVQGIAVIPGISRSGITVSTFLLRKYNNKQAIRLAFLMSIPVVFLGEVVVNLFEGIPEIPVKELVLGLVFSFVFGILTIGALMKLAEKIRFWAFCLIIGFLALVPVILSLV